MSILILKVSIDTSGFITTKPDDFVPTVDIIKGEEYWIYLEIPGF